VQTPNTKAISVSAALRWSRAGATNANDNGSVGLLVKSSAATVNDQVAKARGGYSLTVGDLSLTTSSAGNHRWRLQVYDNQSTSTATGSDQLVRLYNHEFPDTWAATVDVWHHARMDVIPLVDGSDLVKCYSGVLASAAALEPTWTLQGTFIMSAGNGFLQPWVPGGGCGAIHMEMPTSSGGFRSITSYIDKLRLRSKDGGPFSE